MHMAGQRCTCIVEDSSGERSRECRETGVLAEVGRPSAVSTGANGKSRYTMERPQTWEIWT